MTPAVRFDGVVKRYGRRGPNALDGMSFVVPRGAACGLVGPNGAGKTTTFSVISGFLPPDAGTVDLLGEGPFDPWRLKGRLGVLPQDAELPEQHTPLELLTHLGRLQGLDARTARDEAARRLDEVLLGERRDQRIGAMSHGMRRRVAVATALVGGPELVLLDEPSSGLDPVQARSLRDVLRGLRGRQTLVVSSHNLAELEQICDWVVMVDKGRCVRQGSVHEVTGLGELLLWTLGPGDLDLDGLRTALAGASVRREGDQLEVALAGGADPDAASLVVQRHLVAAGIALRGLRRGVSLEERFVRDAAGVS